MRRNNIYIATKMKLIPTLLITIFALNLHAQQNLFNIPSGDITPKAKIFIQQQINLYSINRLESKSHFVYGYGKRSEVGLNFVNLPIRFNNESRFTSIQDNRSNLPLYPALLLTWQHKLINKSKFNINIGTQTGINITNKFNNIRLMYMHYAISAFQIGKLGRIIAGPYFINKYMAGKSSFGLITGYELHITKKFYLMGDYKSGNHAQSATVLGAMYSINRRIQICSGYLIPFKHQGTKSAIVLELNILGFDAF